MIGHTVGFDLAVLKRECDLAGLPWIRPRTLDTRLLAQIAAPELAGYALEKLAAWLGVEFADRHSALGDAATTARVFLALVPKLRDHGIRTVAEAERACLALTSVLDDQARAGWIEAVEAPERADAERTLKRFDSYAYRHRIATSCGCRRSLWRPTPQSTPRSRGWRSEKISAVYVAPHCRSRRRQGGGRGHCHGTRLAARDRPVRRRRARFAGRADHEPAARGGSRGRFRLSRDRPHESSQDPPSRCRR